MKKIFLILFILLFVGSVLAYKPSQIINNNCIETSISKSCNGSIEFYSPRYYDSGFLGMGSKWKEINTNIESCFLLCDYKITTLPYDVEINKNEIKIGLENEEIKIKIKDAKISKVESNKITFDISNKELSAIVEYTFTESKISKLITITQINKETDFDYIEEITHSNKNKIKEDENLIIYDKNNKGMTKRVEKKSNNFETKLTSNEISNMEFPIYIDPSLIIDTGTSIGGTQTYDYVNITNGAVVTINSTGYWNVTANQYFYLCPTCIINGSMVKNLGAGCYYDDGSGCEGGFNGNGDGGKTGQSTGDSQTGGSGGGGGGAGQTCSSAGSGGGGGAGASIISDSNSRFGVFFGAGGGSGGGGGCSSGNGGAGQSALSNNGNGGAGIRIVSPNVNIYGKIYSDAGNGGNGGDGCNSCAEGCGVGYGNGGGGGSGGGSAGTILIDSANINITGATFSAIGGNGGSGGARGGSCTYNGNNGNQGSGGAGGRIKIFYNTISNSSFSYSVAGGSGASAGTTGSIYYLSIPTTLNVTLNYPLDNQNTNNTLVNFNCTGLINSSAGGIYLSNISLWTNSTGTWKKNMTLNVSDYVSYLNVNFTSKINSNEGARTLWSCEACTTDNVCQMSNENRTIIYTTNAPLISVNKPSGLYGYGRNGTILTMNYTISPKIANLDSCWYIYNNKRYNINCSNYLAQNVTQDNFTTNLVIYANDTAGNTASSYTYWNYSIFENSINYNSFASEYSTETYSLNANYDDNYYQVSSAGLNYNGTNYLATKTGSNGNYIFTSNVDISSASLDGEIKSFY